MESLNEEDLRKVCKCSSCGQGIMHGGFPTFYVLKTSRYIVKMDAIKRQSGMEMFMGGNVALAQVFSSGEEMAKRVGEEKTLTFCEDCMQNENMKIMTLNDCQEEEQ